MANLKVRVPASTANLGPGFDALGLALNIYNFVTIEPAKGGDSARMLGEGADSLPTGAENIALVAARHLLDFVGCGDLHFQLTLENGIPLSRGLGSSAAARSGALVAVNEYLKRAGRRFASPSELVTLATQLEGHPDNVAAALLGGLVASTKVESNDEVSALAVRLEVRRFPRLLVFIPDSELATSASRSVLPDVVFRADAVFNVSHTALLVAALAGERWDVLPEALRDRLHQDQRARLMPGFTATLRAAREAGAYGATLSGAGPTVLAWIPDENDAVAEVRQAMESAAAEHEVFGRAVPVEVDFDGTVVVEDAPRCQEV